MRGDLLHVSVAQALKTCAPWVRAFASRPCDARLHQIRRVAIVEAIVRDAQDASAAHVTALKGRPAWNASIISMTWRHRPCIASWLAQPTWGVMMTLGRFMI